jgi:predicted O-methyltransferase YrrM
MLTISPHSDPAPAYRYRDSIYAADLMTAALVHLDFFTWLAANPSSKAAICAHFRFAERPTDVMLTLFAANGFIEKDQHGTFHPTQTALDHLTSTSPWNLAPYYASLKDRPITLDFLQVLATDKPAVWGGQRDQQDDKPAMDWHQAMETEAFSQAFTAAMDCRGHLMGRAMATQLDLTDRRHLLDIGGGSGIYACSLVAHHPHLRATVFEQSPVDKIATRCIAERGCSHQVGVHTGNMFTDPLPQNADIHLFSNVLHDWGQTETLQLLNLSFAALPSGGLLIIHDAFINAHKTGPLPVAEYSAMLMHSTQGKCYSTKEYTDFLTATGFLPGAYLDTTANRGFMTAIKP